MAVGTSAAAAMVVQVAVLVDEAKRVAGAAMVVVKAVAMAKGRLCKCTDDLMSSSHRPRYRPSSPTGHSDVNSPAAHYATAPWPNQLR